MVKIERPDAFKTGNPLSWVNRLFVLAGQGKVIVYENSEIDEMHDTGFRIGPTWSSWASVEEGAFSARDKSPQGDGGISKEKAA